MRAIEPITTIIIIITVIFTIGTVVYYVAIREYYDIREGPTQDMYIFGPPLNSPYPGRAKYRISFSVMYEYSYSGGVYRREVKIKRFTEELYAVNGESTVSIYLATVQKFDIYKCRGRTCSYVGSFIAPVELKDKLGTGPWSYETPPDPVDDTIAILITKDIRTKQEIGNFTLDARYKYPNHNFTTNNVEGRTLRLTIDRIRESGVEVIISVGGNIGPVSTSLRLTYRCIKEEKTTIEVEYTYQAFIYEYFTYHYVDFLGSYDKESDSYPLIWAWKTANSPFYCEEILYREGRVIKYITICRSTAYQPNYSNEKTLVMWLDSSQR